LEAFSINNTSLQSLENLPDFKNLKSIEINSNNLDGSELASLLKYPKLRKINFSNNKVYDFDDIRVLSRLKHITHLSFKKNPVSSVPSYRNEVFEMFPNLTHLDGLREEDEDDIV
jgi:hypothetical protein